MNALKWLESIFIQLPLRIALGAVFCFAAWMKINDVQSFAEAIKGFKVVSIETHEHLIIIGAFTMPWIEMIAGILLILGLCTRAAAATIGIMLIVFIAALLHVIFDDSISADCSCFGDMKLVCSASVGWCQVIRDLIMLLPVAYLLYRGPGNLALDTLIDPNTPAQSAIQGSKADSTLDQDTIRA